MAASAEEAVWERVLRSSALEEGARKCVRLGSGRGVMLIRLGGAVKCIDHACYHHGGPLLHADIEELGDHTCIVCPWHHYKIDLDTGEGVYVGLDADALASGRQEGTVKSKGVKQRVHRVHEGATAPGVESGALDDSWVFVQENASPAVRAAVAEDAEAAGHGGLARAVMAQSAHAHHEGSTATVHAPVLGPGASGGSSTVRSGHVISKAGIPNPKLHSTAPWSSKPTEEPSFVSSVVSMATSVVASVTGSSAKTTAGSAPHIPPPTKNPKPRRDDPPEGWLPSDDYAALPF
jgi:nitrite reductase/ring-hydroxylating ferredoxin subunit